MVQGGPDKLVSVTFSTKEPHTIDKKGLGRVPFFLPLLDKKENQR